MSGTYFQRNYGEILTIGNCYNLGKGYCVRAHSCLTLLDSQWTVACQAPLSLGFPRQEYQSGLPFLPPGDLPHSGIKPASLHSPALQVDTLLLSHQESIFIYTSIIVNKTVQNAVLGCNLKISKMTE